MVDTCAQSIDLGFTALGYGRVAVLGVIQGVTELLPISSTAHMRVIPALLGWRDPGSAFSAVMQLAALAAVLSYFWSDVAELISGSVRALVDRDFQDRRLRLCIWIALATLPIGIAGIALAATLNACDSPLRELSVIGWASIGMAGLLAITEVKARHKRTIDDISFADTMMVGLAQIGALIPGVSRSGATLTAGLALGFRREVAAKLSFLLGLPAITAAGAKELWELYQAPLDVYGWSILAVGLLVASLSAFGAVWGLMAVLERFSAWPFVVYRGVFGAALLIGNAAGWLL